MIKQTKQSQIYTELETSEQTVRPACARKATNNTIKT